MHSGSSFEGLKGQVRPFLKPPTTKILEVNRKVERKELLQGIKLLTRAIFATKRTVAFAKGPNG